MYGKGKEFPISMVKDGFNDAVDRDWFSEFFER